MFGYVFVVSCDFMGEIYGVFLGTPMPLGAQSGTTSEPIRANTNMDSIQFEVSATAFGPGALGIV